MKYVSISLFQSAQSILTQFSGSLQQRALANFKATGVDVRLGVAVTKVTRDELVIKVQGQDDEEVIPYGICVWSTGMATRTKLCCDGLHVPGSYIPLQHAQAAGKTSGWRIMKYLTSCRCRCRNITVFELNMLKVV